MADRLRRDFAVGEIRFTRPDEVTFLRPGMVVHADTFRFKNQSDRWTAEDYCAFVGMPYGGVSLLHGSTTSASCQNLRLRRSLFSGELSVKKKMDRSGTLESFTCRVPWLRVSEIIHD